MNDKSFPVSGRHIGFFMEDLLPLNIAIYSSGVFSRSRRVCSGCFVMRMTIKAKCIVLCVIEFKTGKSTTSLGVK